ncbi:hypothetical protein QYM36_016601 [Artemia franciscana]|uniref:Ig-like domain-containing protein n=2 Tax=Artemia franciscana TaxID=6661 RepID=A0AA88KWL2_ARTSF|nr:hypothetical protein QYM36_016601 [Artemia franciscana]
MIGLTITMFSEARIFEKQSFAHLLQVAALYKDNLELPCDIKSPILGDNVILVIWYKGNQESPAYTFDARSKSGTLHWSEATISRRWHFVSNAQPAVLKIAQVELSDMGEYRCRVDFKKAKTRNTFFNVTVIVPPHDLIILDEIGEAVHSIAGPYIEDEESTFLCVATGGSPEPNITWEKNGVPIMLSDISAVPSSQQNWIHVFHHRSNLQAAFTCVADNTDGRRPLRKSFTIDIILLPKNVKLTSEKGSFRDGNEAVFQCQVDGVKSAPLIHWYLNSKLLDVNSACQNNVLQMEMICRLTLNLTREMHGKDLECKIEINSTNKYNDNASKHSGSSLTLDVQYAPKVELKLGRNLENSIVPQGGDAYFECHFDSNPQPKKIIWRKEGKMLSPHAGYAYLISGITLVLQRVNRQAVGSYSCFVKNDIGSTESPAVQLKIKSPPFCAMGQSLEFPVEKHETVSIPCVLESNPPASSFYWHFNSSSHFIDLTHTQIKGNIMDISKDSQLQSLSSLSSTTSEYFQTAVSVIPFTPRTSLDFGPIYCFGVNEIGQQEEPCIFQVLQLSIPVSPQNCVIRNQTENFIDIGCTNSFGGNLPQTFVLEAIDQNSKELILNMSSSVPEFNVIFDGQVSSVRTFSDDSNELLWRNTTVLFNIYSSNSKGSSSPVILKTMVAQPKQISKTGVEMDLFSRSTFGSIIVCTAAIVFALVIIATMFIKVCKRTELEIPRMSKISRNQTPDVTNSVQNDDQKFYQSDPVIITSNPRFKYSRKHNFLAIDCMAENEL